MSELPVFVDHPCVTYQGEEALKRLADTNDQQYATADGILKVDYSRWQLAQEYERKTWLETARGQTDSRNYEFAWGFDGYHALPDYLGAVIELGCGPFTNLRLILEWHKAISVTLLDPLVVEYTELPECPYAFGYLRSTPVKIITTPLEEWIPETFDLVIMCNVLHHCYDANRVLENVFNSVHPGGLLVFYELPRVIDPALTYDVGHPLAPTAEYIERFIARFTEVYRNGWYYIGRKNG